jgi:hypothetical protein
MTFRELAEKLNVSVATIYAWTKRGIIIDGRQVYLRSQRIGGRRYVSAEFFEDFKAACNPEPVKSAPRNTTTDHDLARRKEAQRRLAQRLKGGTD